jgi:hypothetical protein
MNSQGTGYVHVRVNVGFFVLIGEVAVIMINTNHTNTLCGKMHIF